MIRPDVLIFPTIILYFATLSREMPKPYRDAIAKSLTKTKGCLQLTGNKLLLNQQQNRHHLFRFCKRYRLVFKVYAHRVYNIFVSYN